MIVSQFREVRRFMGRLDPGQDVIAAFRTICKENSISNAWVLATAVLRKPTISKISAQGLEAQQTLDSTVFCPSINGNISVEKDAPSIRLYTECHDDSGQIAMGALCSGEVLMCEFLIIAFDDVAFVRQSSERFGPWMQIQLGADTPAQQPPRPTEGLLMPRLTSTRAATDEDETSELHILEMKEGDYVDHPKFGLCRIVHAPTDDKVTIRLGNGKHVDLHLGVMKVLSPKISGGKKVFQVEVRKRT